MCLFDDEDLLVVKSESVEEVVINDGNALESLTTSVRLLEANQVRHHRSD